MRARGPDDLAVSRALAAYPRVEHVQPLEQGELLGREALASPGVEPRVGQPLGLGVEAAGQAPAPVEERRTDAAREIDIGLLEKVEEGARAGALGNLESPAVVTGRRIDAVSRHQQVDLELVGAA